MNVLTQMRGMMGAFHPSQMDYGTIFMDMDVDMEDQLAMMEAMGGEEGPKIKLVDGDFFNNFQDDFDDSDVE